MSFNDYLSATKSTIEKYSNELDVLKKELDVCSPEKRKEIEERIKKAMTMLDIAKNGMIC